MSDEKKNLFKSANEYKENPNLQAELEAEMQNKTNAQLVEEAAALDLEARKLELEYKKQEMEYRAIDMKIKKDQLAKLEAQYNTAINNARSRNLATLQFLANREANQKRCNHRKGGRGPDAVMRGIGDDSNRSIIHHKLPDGGIMVLCQRCGKEWYPARKWNSEDGILRPIAATLGWEEAVQWNTDNSPSGSSTFLFEKVVQ